MCSGFQRLVLNCWTLPSTGHNFPHEGCQWKWRLSDCQKQRRHQLTCDAAHSTCNSHFESMYLRAYMRLPNSTYSRCAHTSQMQDVLFWLAFNWPASASLQRCAFTLHADTGDAEFCLRMMPCRAIAAACILHPGDSPVRLCFKILRGLAWRPWRHQQPLAPSHSENGLFTSMRGTRPQAHRTGPKVAWCPHAVLRVSGVPGFCARPLHSMRLPQPARRAAPEPLQGAHVGHVQADGSGAHP